MEAGDNNNIWRQLKKLWLLVVAVKTTEEKAELTGFQSNSVAYSYMNDHSLLELWLPDGLVMFRNMAYHLAWLSEMHLSLRLVLQGYPQVLLFLS